MTPPYRFEIPPSDSIGLVQAIEWLRSGPREDTIQSVEIALAEGVYELAEPLILTPEHLAFCFDETGKRVGNLTLRGAANGNTQISGGKRITEWEEIRLGTLTAWRTILPSSLREIDSLFIDGSRIGRVRTPREGFFKFPIQDPFRKHSGKEWTLNGNEFSSQSAALFSKINVLRYWVDLHLPVKSLSDDLKTVCFWPEDFPSLSDENAEGARFFIENDLGRLEHPFDWYMNPKTGELIFVPPAGKGFQDIEIIAPSLPLLLSIQGDQTATGEKAEGVLIENISFSHCHWALPKTNWGAGQAQFFFPGAIQLKGAKHCRLQNCLVSVVCGAGIEVLRGSTENEIIGCEVSFCGSSAIKINHDGPLAPWGSVGPDAFVDLDRVEMGWEFPDPMVEKESVLQSCTVISDCEIHDVGLIYPSAPAIWVGDSWGNKIVHNSIHHTFYTAISIGWTWGYRHTHCGKNLVAHNKISEIGQGALSDMGAIYLLGDQPGTIVRSNVVQRVTAFGYGGVGIYPDEGTSGVVIEFNHVTDCGSDAFAMHYGRDVLVRNNSFEGTTKTVVYPSRPEPFRTVTFRQNTFAGKESLFRASPGTAWFSGNHYSFPQEPLFGTLDFSTWTKEFEPDATVMGEPMPHPQAVGPRSPGERSLPLPHGNEEQVVFARLEFGHGGAWQERTKPGSPPEPSIDSREPVPFSLVVRNISSEEHTAIPQVVLSSRRGDAAGEIHLNLPQKVTLVPGEVQIFDGEAVLAADQGEGWIVASLGQPGDPGSALLLPRRGSTQIAKLQNSVSLDEIPDLLGSLEPFRGETERFELWVAVTPDSMVVLADVRDRFRVVKGMPWDGAAVEVFTADLGGNGRNHNSQIFLIPGTDSQKAKAIPFASDLVASDEAEVDFALTPLGYRIWARLPLTLIRLSESAGEFLFEAQVKSALHHDSDYVRTSLFGGAIGHDNNRWGIAQVVNYP
ncbi:MAG: right-handed parallel beta-helix repeat-containing protein [Fimbriimonadaceae bacterium]|nr:right-handed parallel beta-helix repeat-containing protein [Fimbriimonadaceae bacterium]